MMIKSIKTPKITKSDGRKDKLPKQVTIGSKLQTFNNNNHKNS